MKRFTAFWQRSPNLLGLLLMAAVIVALPVFLRSDYVSTGIFIGIAAILTLGLCMLMGYAGQISLGHAAFYGLGAYASAVLTVKLGLSPWVAMALGVLITGVMAYLIGKVIFRLTGHYLAVATLGLGIVVFIAFNEFGAITGGSTGLPGVPRLAVGSFVFDTDTEYFYLVWAVVIALMALSLNIVNSRVGRGLRAIHGSEAAAESIGVDSSRYKLQVLVLSAMYASIAGSLYVHYMRFVSPTPFDFHASVRLVVMAAVGGLASVWGAPFGAAAIILLTALLRDNLGYVIPDASGEHAVIAYGIILVVIMIFLPQGLTSGMVSMKKWRFSKSKN